MKAQQAHPEVAENPDPNPVDGTDAGRVVRVLETYQNDVATPDKVDQPITINVN